MRIDNVTARSILDSRGKPTLETTISANTVSASASVPSGKSTGIHEAVELRDPDGGVTTAVEQVNTEIAKALIGRRFETLDELDSALIELDGTPNKSRLGANAILSVSFAAQRLSALLANKPLWKSIAERGNFTPAAPRLYMNVMNGGVHADFHLPFQEYILVVEGKTSEAYPIAQDAFKKLGEMLGDVPMGDEGGYAPTFDTLEKPFELLAKLVEEFPHTSIAIDAAASEFYHNGRYTLLGTSYSADELASLYAKLVATCPFHSIEDPFDEESTEDFAQLSRTLGEKILIVGDDFTVTNPSRIRAAHEASAINAVLIKPNQIGTVQEALQAVRDTYTNGWQAIASHRSGETKDTFIADFAYGVGAHGIKAGGLGQQERLEKYERLLAIEHEARL
jgi:enolase